MSRYICMHRGMYHRACCNEPAVDFIELDGRRYWLCAEHYDRYAAMTPDTWGLSWSKDYIRVGVHPIELE